MGFDSVARTHGLGVIGSDSLARNHGLGLMSSNLRHLGKPGRRADLRTSRFALVRSSSYLCEVLRARAGLSLTILTNCAALSQTILLICPGFIPEQIQ